MLHELNSLFFEIPKDCEYLFLYTFASLLDSKPKTLIAKLELHRFMVNYGLSLARPFVFSGFVFLNPNLAWEM